MTGWHAKGIPQLPSASFDDRKTGALALVHWKELTTRIPKFFRGNPWAKDYPGRLPLQIMELSEFETMCPGTSVLFLLHTPTNDKLLEYNSLEQGQPAVVNHKGAPLVLASESKAHAQTRAPVKGSKAPHKHVKPLRHVSTSSAPSSSGSLSPPARSPTHRPSKRVRTDESQSTADDHRVIRGLPHQLPVQYAELGLKRKAPGGPPQRKASAQLGAVGPSNFPAPGGPSLPRPHGFSPPSMPVYSDMRGSSMPTGPARSQPAFPPQSFLQPMHHMLPSMYQHPTHSQTGYWGQPPPQMQWQQPSFPSNMTPDEYQDWYEMQQ